MTNQTQIISFDKLIQQYEVPREIVEGLISEEILFPTPETTGKKSMNTRFLLSNVTEIFGKGPVPGNPPATFCLEEEIEGIPVFKIFEYPSAESAASSIANFRIKLAGQKLRFSVFMLGKNIYALSVFLQLAITKKRIHWPLDKAQILFPEQNTFTSFLDINTPQGVKPHVPIYCIDEELRTRKEVSLPLSKVAAFFGFPEKPFKTFCKKNGILILSGNQIQTISLASLLRKIKMGEVPRPKYMPKKGGCFSELLFWVTVGSIVAYEADIYGARKYFIKLGNWCMGLWDNSILPWLIEQMDKFNL